MPSSLALRFAGTTGITALRSGALHLVERGLLAQTVVELGGAGRLVPDVPGRGPEIAAVSQGLDAPLASEAVGANLGWKPHLVAQGRYGPSRVE